MPSITTGGVAQQLLPARSGRRFFCVQNQSSGPLYVNNAGTAAADDSSILVPPGALYESPEWLPRQDAISIFGATTGQTFAVREA